MSSSEDTSDDEAAPKSTGNSAGNPTPNLNWSKNEKIFPDFKFIVGQLQDEGKSKAKQVKGKSEVGHTYPAIDKLSQTIIKGIKKEYKNHGLGANIHRDAKELTKCILTKRKHVDFTEQHPAFHPHQKKGMVFLCRNCPKYAGLENAIALFQVIVGQRTKKKSAVRTPSLGIRTALAMLRPDTIEAVGLFLSGKRDRKKHDQSHDPDDALFDQLAVHINSSEFHVPPPNADDYAQFPSGKQTWQPNDPSILEKKHDGAYVRQTWETYIKPKYKLVLNKWNKETGGGDGTPVSFQEYCNAADKWLVWVFLEDMAKGFVLACNAGSRLPAHLQLESGISTPGKASAITDDDVPSSAESKKINSKVEELDTQIAALKRNRETLNKTMIEGLEIFKQTRVQSNPTVDEGRMYLDDIQRCSEQMTNEALLNSMSPDSKKVYVEQLKKRRRSSLAKLKEYSAKEDSPPGTKKG